MIFSNSNVAHQRANVRQKHKYSDFQENRPVAAERKITETAKARAERSRAKSKQGEIMKKKNIKRANVKAPLTVKRKYDGKEVNERVYTNTPHGFKSSEKAAPKKTDKPATKTKTPAPKKSKKIEFGRLGIDGKVVKAKGDYYKMSNGIEVAIHKDKNKKYYATELSTGKLVTLRSGETSIVDTVNFVEKYSSEIKKAIDTNTQIPASVLKTAKQPVKKTDKPKSRTATPKNATTTPKTVAPKPTVAKTSPKATGKSPSVSKNSVRTAVTAKAKTSAPDLPKKSEQPTEKRRVYKSLPKGYSVVQGTVAQSDGTILIHNGKPLFKQGKDGTTQQAKDRRGRPAHKTAALVVDPKAFNEAKTAERKLVDVEIRTHKDAKGGHPHIMVDTVGDKNVSVGTTHDKYKGKKHANIPLEVNPLGENRQAYMRKQGTVDKKENYSSTKQKGKMTVTDNVKAKQIGERAKQKELNKQPPKK